MITEMGARDIAAAIRGGALSPVEAVEAFISRIDAVDAVINAVVVRNFDRAVEEARGAAAALVSGDPVGPLHGVPVTIKEAIATEGLPWTSGSRLFGDVVADRDADAVRHLRAAGAIVIGKTNNPEFCGWYDTDGDRYGRTANPFAPEHSPGGSSGGEAAALAARLSPLGLGSDLASSIRQPAAWTGVLGLKPSRDAVSFDGHAGLGLPPGIRAFAALGPMARTVDDIRLAFEVLTGRPVAPPDPVRLSVAVFEDDGLQPVASSCRQAVRRAAGALEEAGHAVEEAAPPSTRDVRAAFDTVVATDLRLVLFPRVADRLDELSDYGRRALGGLAAFEPDVGAYVAAGYRLGELEAEADRWLERHPVVICPVVPVPAPIASIGLVDADGEAFRPGGKLTLCTWANALGLPAMSVPAGLDQQGLPLAVQVVGRRGCDADVMAVAGTLEAALGGSPDPRVSQPPRR